MAAGAASDSVYRLVATALDTRFYRAIYDDVAEGRVDPVRHYVDAGWREGRDPAPWFSTRAYQEDHPDTEGLNPFHHYLQQGWREGRQARGSDRRGLWLVAAARAAEPLDWDFEPPAPVRAAPAASSGTTPDETLGFRHDVIAGLRPLAERVAAAQARSTRVAAGGLAQLEAAMTQRRASDGALHISVSHDDFTAHVGGVQLCLQREAAALAAQRVDHLHLHPATPWPTLRTADQLAPVGVLWNGQVVGVFPADVIAQALARARHRVGGGRRSFALHSLLGHSVDEVLAVLAAADLRRGHFWLHDFTSLCAGVHLLRDDVADCGAPPLGSPACGICVYGPGRAAHVEAHARLFAALDLIVAAPSQAAFDTWRAATPAPVGQTHVIHPHARLVASGSLPQPAGDGPLTVAFLGAPVGYKGWPVFRALAAARAGDPRYRFVHLASTPVRDAPSNIAHHPVTVTAEAPQAMREALVELGVDVAILWSLCRETFSFTAHEAATAGVAVLTGPDSGNIAAFVADGRFGRALAGEGELVALFESGRACDLARSVRKPAAYDLVLGALTVDLLGAR